MNVFAFQLLPSTDAERVIASRACDFPRHLRLRIILCGREDNLISLAYPISDGLVCRFPLRFKLSLSFLLQHRVSCHAYAQSLRAYAKLGSGTN